MTAPAVEILDLPLSPPGGDGRPLAGDRSRDSWRTARLPGLSALESGVVEAVAYADVFDWPLTPGEIQRYLPIAGARLEIDDVLARSPAIREMLACRRGLVTLGGR